MTASELIAAANHFSDRSFRPVLTRTAARFPLIVATLTLLAAGFCLSPFGQAYAMTTLVSPQQAVTDGQETAEGMEAIPQPDTTLNLWPAKPPGETAEFPAEADTSGPESNRVAGKYVIRLGNVSTPQLAIYRPPADRDTGMSVVICPGGGYHILAYDLEGTEVAQWLNEQGITGIVLKYRVPARPEQPRWQAAVQDVQRAISTVRNHAKQWNLNPDQIGVLGFSAGGHAAGMASLLQEDRKYESTDTIDQQPCSPNFAVLVYPAYLFDAETGKLSNGLTIPDGMGPMFLVHAQDDPVTPMTSLLLATELKKKDVPVELHLYNEGGHGYGLRKTQLPVTHWTELCEPWLKKLQQK